MTNFSIIICAYNRCKSVKELLECLVNQEDDFFDVCVSDNNSNDNTKTIVESMMPAFNGRLQYLFEPRQGKSYALNSAIAKSKGDVLVFIDDDCLVEKDYSARVRQAIEKYGKDADFFGGRILLHWEGGPCPAWLDKIINDQTEYAPSDRRHTKRKFFRAPLAMLDYGSKPFPLSSAGKRYKSFLFYGPNMVIKKNVIEKIGGYDPAKIITQDTDMCLRLIRSGVKGMYVPDVLVYHKVPIAKVTPAYYRRWFYQRGCILETWDDVPKKFYHPFGIRNGMIGETAFFYWKSMSASTMPEKIFNRGRASFNLGQMLKIAGQNII